MLPGTRRLSSCCGCLPLSTGWSPTSSTSKHARHAGVSLLFVGILVNLGMLSYFKYGGFILENFQALMATIGIDYKAPDWNIVLPVGISFYTFQTMAYSLDVYLKRAKPAESFLDFALFVTFFPQLIAGPIVRFEQVTQYDAAILQLPVSLHPASRWGCVVNNHGLVTKS